MQFHRTRAERAEYTDFSEAMDMLLGACIDHGNADAADKLVLKDRSALLFSSLSLSLSLLLRLSLHPCPRLYVYLCGCACVFLACVDLRRCGSECVTVCLRTHQFLIRLFVVAHSLHSLFLACSLSLSLFLWLVCLRSTLPLHLSHTPSFAPCFFPEACGNSVVSVFTSPINYVSVIQRFAGHVILASSKHLVLNTNRI